MDGLKTAEPQSPQWHAWLECERALTADTLYNRPRPEARIEQAQPEQEPAFDVFERRGQKRGRGIGHETE